MDFPVSSYTCHAVPIILVILCYSFSIILLLNMVYQIVSEVTKVEKMSRFVVLGTKTKIGVNLQPGTLFVIYLPILLRTLLMAIHKFDRKPTVYSIFYL